MRVTFIGVGEAFDDTLGNTSLLVETDRSSLLLDCGFTAGHAFWGMAASPLELDALYITHYHGDHYFGLPVLLVRSVEEGRTKPLTIMGQPGAEDRVTRLMELAYGSIMERARFDLHFVETTPEDNYSLNDLRLRFAMNDHPMPCQSVRLDSDTGSVFYSGDGRPTRATRDLARNVELIVHESFSLEPTTPGHGTVDSSLDFARTAGANQLALVHMNRSIRREKLAQVMAKAAEEQGLNVRVPIPGDVVEL